MPVVRVEAGQWLLLHSLHLLCSIYTVPVSSIVGP